MELGESMERAVQNGDIEEVVRLVRDDGFPVNEADPKDMMTPLLKASMWGHLPIVKYLVSAKANVHATHTNGSTAVMLASNSGYLDVIRFLVTKDVDINASAHSGAAWVRGYTALMNASHGGHLDVVKFLIEQNADTTLENKRGKTAEMIARHSGKDDVANYIASHKSEDKGFFGWLGSVFGFKKEEAPEPPKKEEPRQRRQSGFSSNHSDSESYSERRSDMEEKLDYAGPNRDTVNELVGLFRILKIRESYAQKFIDEDVDVASLPTLSDDDVAALLPTIGSRNKLLNYIQRIKSEQDPTFSPRKNPSSDSGSKSGDPSHHSESASQSGSINPEEYLQRANLKINHKELQYSENQLIGAGAFGRVYRGKYLGTDVAIKVLPKDSIKSGRLVRELAIWKDLKFPTLIALLGACLEPQPCIVMPICSGSLTAILKTEQLSKQQTLRICKQIGAGMAYLHSRDPPIFHRDLKGRNILLTQDREVRICDFGISKHFRPSMTRSVVGTTACMAPEILDAQEFTEKSDVYGYAMIMYELITGIEPWDKLESDAQILMKVFVNQERPEVPSSLQASFPRLTKLMYKCWAQNPDNRPTFAEVGEELDDISKDIDVFDGPTPQMNSSGKSKSTRNVCIICMEEDRNIVFTPCGHLSCCENCQSVLDTCPQCRTKIEGRVKAFV